MVFICYYGIECDTSATTILSHVPLAKTHRLTRLISRSLHLKCIYWTQSLAGRCVCIRTFDYFLFIFDNTNGMSRCWRTIISDELYDVWIIKQHLSGNEVGYHILIRGELWLNYRFDSQGFYCVSKCVGLEFFKL